MTFTHDDIQARLIEFLYGELDGEARAAFDVHVAGCQRCRSEVAAFEQTRAAARAVVRAPLAEPVPAAVLSRVMEAAMRAAGERASATVNRDAVRAQVARAGGDTPRWLAWLRAHWTFPVLTTAAAMGALLLFRETIFREARRPLGDATMEKLAPKPAPPPSVAEVPKTVAPDLDKERRADDKRRAPEVTARNRGSSPGRVSADGVEGLSERKAKGAIGAIRKKEENAAAKASASPDSIGFGGGKREQPALARDDLDDLLTGAIKESGQRQRPNDQRETRLPAKSAPIEREVPIDVSEGLAPPPPSVARKPTTGPPPSGAPRAPAAPAAEEAAEEDSPKSRPSVVSGASEAEREASPRASRAKKMRKGFESAEADAPVSVSEPGARSSGASAPTSSASQPAGDPVAVLVDRAEKLMVARRWAQAAAAYRDLLQRFPQHAAVPTWRRRLAAAQVAAAQDQNQPGGSGFATPPPPR